MVWYSHLCGAVVKNSPAKVGDITDAGSILGPEDLLATHSSVLAQEFHGQRSLVGYSPWGHKESDMTDHHTCI